MYLRSIMIVFRDMKPDNVLIFNTSLDSPVRIITDTSSKLVTILAFPDEFR